VDQDQSVWVDDAATLSEGEGEGEGEGDCEVSKRRVAQSGIGGEIQKE
jgi:hypothetical protein